MAFKISNETKVGALTAISITLLILGFNFLKGKNITKKSRYLYAQFQKIDGLLPANPVVMNGLSIGSVYKTEPGDADLDWILVTIRLDEEINIPSNSVAKIKSSLLGSNSLEIVKGNANSHLNPGDTIPTMDGGGFLGGALAKLEPTQKNLDQVMLSVDTLLDNVNDILDEKGKQDLRETLAHLNAITLHLTETTRSLNGLINAQTGVVTKTFNNLESFTSSLNELNATLPSIARNLDTTSQHLSQLDFQQTLNSIDKSMASLNAVLAKANDPGSSIGAILNDRKLYNNLTNTVNSLNLLMQDVRINPKRYVNISVFGKKSTPEPLMRPLVTDTATLEQSFPPNQN